MNSGRRLGIFLICLILTIFTGCVSAPNRENERRLFSGLKFEITETIKTASYYTFDPKRVDEFTECFILPNVYQDYEFNVNARLKKCLSEDKYAYYLSNSRAKNYLEGNSEEFIQGKEIEQDIGYLKVGSFGLNKTGENKIYQILASFDNRGLKGLIIDFRGNLGGNTETMRKFTAKFSPSGKNFLFEFRERDGYINPQNRFWASTRGQYSHFKVVVLIDRNTASAAETASLILRRWGAVLIGQNTLGKSFAQQAVQLRFGEYLILTAARVYLEGEITYDENGITPDIKANSDAEYFHYALGHLRQSTRQN